MYTIEISNAAKREFRRLPTEIQTRMRTMINTMTDEPRPPGVRKLAYPSGTYRLRIGQYRIVYEVDDSTRLIRIIAVGPRGSVYRGL